MKPFTDSVWTDFLNPLTGFHLTHYEVFFCNLLKWPLNLQSELRQCKMLTFMVLLGTILSREKRYSLSYLCDLASVCRVTVGQSGLAGALVTGESRESQLSVFSARDNKSL